MGKNENHCQMYLDSTSFLTISDTNYIILYVWIHFSLEVFLCIIAFNLLCNMPKSVELSQRNTNPAGCQCICANENKSGDKKRRWFHSQFGVFIFPVTGLKRMSLWWQREYIFITRPTYLYMFGFELDESHASIITGQDGAQNSSIPTPITPSGVFASFKAT